MSYAWKLSDQKIDKECKTLFIEYKDNNLCINSEEIPINNRKIELIIDFPTPTIKAFIFQKLDIDYICFSKEQMRIMLAMGERKEKDSIKIVSNCANGIFYDYILNRNTIKEPPQAIPLTDSKNYKLQTYFICFQFCTIANVSFQKGLYENKVEFQENTFLDYWGIQQVEFLEEISFRANVFERKFWINNSVFNKKFTLQVWRGKTSDEVEICNSDFQEKVFLFGSTFEKLKIETTNFKQKVYFGSDKQDKESIDYGNSVFSHSLKIDNCSFEDRVFFEFCIFQAFYLANSIFKNDIFFNYANFNENHFSKTTFDRSLSFYQAIFKEAPFITNCLFDKQIIMTGSKIECKDKDLLKSIDSKAKKLVENYQKNKPSSSRPQREKNYEDFLKDFRDGFCSIKNALIKNNNLLDASSYHKVELCCRELELEKKNPKPFSKDWIDKWQLWFYRQTSEHHTDLLRAFNSLLCLVFIFGVLSCGAMIWFAYYFDKTFSILNLSNLQYLQVIYNSHISLLIHNHPYCIFGINLGFIALFLFLFWISIFKYSRYFFVPLGYVTSIVLFAISPKLLMPAIGFFTDKREILDPLSIIGGIYTLLFGFLAYSFIKTARKNSIIPN